MTVAEHTPTNAEDPVGQICELMEIWVGGHPTRSEVLAELAAGGWYVLSQSQVGAAIFATPSRGNRLVAVFDEVERLAGFTAAIAANPAASAVPAAVRISMVAQRLWGQMATLQPRRAVWETPGGRCEVEERDGDVLIRWHGHADTTIDGPVGGGVGQRCLDDLVATAALDERWPAAVDTACRLLGDAAPTRWPSIQVGALFVLVIARSQGTAPEQVTADQLHQHLRRLQRRLGSVRT